jgi:hypothetical protein
MSDDAIRRLLRDLPEVPPPKGWFEGLIHRRRQRARALATGSLVAAGLVGVLVVAQTTGITGTASTPIAELAGRHQRIVTIGPLASEPAMDPDEVPPPYPVPAQLGDLDREMVIRHDDGVVHVLYRHDDMQVSVFEQAGEPDMGAMPDEMEPMPVDEVNVLLVQRDDVVYVVMGEASPAALTEVAEDLPAARPMSLADRIGDAMDDLVRAFGFD